MVDAGRDGVTGYEHLDQEGENRVSMRDFNEGEVIVERVRHNSFRNDISKQRTIYIT